MVEFTVEFRILICFITMVSFRALASASVISLAACDWCYTHTASQIFDAKTSPGMLPVELWSQRGAVAAFDQDDGGTRYFMGHSIHSDPGISMIVKSVPDEHKCRYDTHSIMWSWPFEYGPTFLTVSRDGSSVFISFRVGDTRLQECRPSDQIPPGPCIEISKGEDHFWGLAYDDENEDLYASTTNVVKNFRRAANRQWVSNGIVAGNADGGPRADLTGLNHPGALRFNEGDLFIVDYQNSRIVRWTPTEPRANSEYKTGVKLGMNALSVYEGKIYFLELTPVDATVSSMEVANPGAPKKKVAGGCGRGIGDNQLSGNPLTSLHAGPPLAGRLVILDGKRVVEWELNPPATSDKGGPLL